MPLKMTPPDEGEGEALMLLFTVHGPGGYADNNDFTYGESETRFDAGPLRITTPLDQNMKVPEDIEITHIIIYVRACIFSPGVNDFTQSCILYGTPQSGHRRAFVAGWPVGSDFITLDSGTLPTSPSGAPWEPQEVLDLIIGAEAIWNGLSFVSGTINMSECYIEVYGRENNIVRSRKFSNGVYRLSIGPRVRIARLTADQVRSIYESARLPKEDGTYVPLSFRVVSLDGGYIRDPAAVKIDSTYEQLLAALAAAREPNIG